MKTKKLSFVEATGMKHLPPRTIRFIGKEFLGFTSGVPPAISFKSSSERDWSYQFKGNFTVKFYSDTSATGRGFRLHFRSSKLILITQAVDWCWNIQLKLIKWFSWRRQVNHNGDNKDTVHIVTSLNDLFHSLLCKIRLKFSIPG